MPPGVIVMWSGLLSAIPSGWALCDGQGGRPDLRERFVKGAAEGVDPGATGGGSYTPQGTVSAPSFTGTPFTSVINHTHVVTVNDPGHAHTQRHLPTATGALIGQTIDTSMSGTLANSGITTANATTGITATTANPAGGVTSITPAGAISQPTFSGQAATVEPVFLALAYIIKL